MSGEHVLVVDDGKENREFIVEYVLQPYGFAASTARDGLEALESIAAQPPDVILLDYQMPRMNGIEMLREMHTRGIHIPVILMTFYGSEEVAVEVYRLGISDYIAKPFTVEEMVTAIERALTSVRLLREKEQLTHRLIDANRELQSRLQEMNVLYAVGKNVSALAEPELLLPRIVEAAVRLTAADEGLLFIQQEERLICRARKRSGDSRASASSAEMEDAAAKRVMQHGSPLLVNGAVGVPSQAYAPLVLGGHVVGALGVRSPRRAFTRHQASLLAALSDYAAIAIQNSGTMDSLRRQKDNESSRIRSLFQRFVSHQVVDQVLDNPDLLQLGGKRREITILFTDIRGYTTFSEHLPPEQVVEMLNDYLSLAANTIMSYGGTLDKYIGDGLMAIFNAPEDHPEHTRSALAAAITLQAGARHLEAQRGDGLSFGIGIHTGEAVVGFIGTDCAMNYTAVGDVVNLAKRLQETARPGQILIEAGLVSQMSDAIEATPLGELRIRGRSQSAEVYELTALR